MPKSWIIVYNWCTKNNNRKNPTIFLIYRLTSLKCNPFLPSKYKNTINERAYGKSALHFQNQKVYPFNNKAPKSSYFLIIHNFWQKKIQKGKSLFSLPKVQARTEVLCINFYRHWKSSIPKIPFSKKSTILEDLYGKAPHYTFFNKSFHKIL
jgi:hypothetical protein